MGESSGDNFNHKSSYGNGCKRSYGGSRKGLEDRIYEELGNRIHKQLDRGFNKGLERQFYKSLYGSQSGYHENNSERTVGDVNVLSELERLKLMMDFSSFLVTGKNNEYLRNFYDKAAAWSNRYDSLESAEDRMKDLYSAIYEGLNSDRYRLRDVERFMKKTDGELRDLFAYAAADKKISGTLEDRLGKDLIKEGSLSMTINSKGYVTNVRIGSSNFKVNGTKKAKLY